MGSSLSSMAGQETAEAKDAATLATQPSDSKPVTVEKGEYNLAKAAEDVSKKRTLHHVAGRVDESSVKKQRQSSSKPWERQRERFPPKQDVVLEKEEDLRRNVTLDAPIQDQYILRVKRDGTGQLQLDTNGEPLYSDSNFIEKHSTDELLQLVEKKKQEKTKSDLGDGKGPNHYRSNVINDRQKNFLRFDLKKQLRKRGAVRFERADSKDKLWDENLFESGELTGGFAVPEKRRIDLRGKLYLAPLTTVGNLPFRLVCKRLGADVTCGEMAMATNILQGQASEWALLRRHVEEDLFGVQLAGSNQNTVARAAELIGRECDVDFIELNSGCPIDLLFNKGGGCALMKRSRKLMRMTWTVAHATDVPVGVKMRTGVDAKTPIAHTLIPQLAHAGAQWVTVHGRSRKQRYSKNANWDYITGECAPAARRAGIPLLGNGDVYNWWDATRFFDQGEQQDAGVSSVMIARGALIKPWLFTEIKERRVWDIRSTERLDIYKQFAHIGLDHWGGDMKGVETTRRFLLEWLSFLYRYVPIGIVEGGANAIVTMSHRAPFFRGRDDLETLLGSSKSSDWVRITEMLLGKAPDGFKFQPRHKSNAWGEDAPGQNG